MPATELPGDMNRRDPYTPFMFRVKWSDKVVAAFSKVSGLARTSQTVTYRTGDSPASPHRLPGQAAYEAITLERGVTHDPEFETWANRALMPGTESGGQSASSVDFRRDLTIELYSEAGQKVVAYTVYGCWVSSYTGMPDRDGGNAVMIESMTIQNEGWMRDPGVAGPSAPSFG